MVTESAKTNTKIKQAHKPSTNGRVQSPAPDFSDAPEKLHLEEFNYAEVKAAAEAMEQYEKELQRKGIKETEAERDLRIYGTKDIGELTTMEMLRRNPYYALKVLESDDKSQRGYGLECDWCEVNGERLLQPIKILTPHNPYPDERHKAIMKNLQRHWENSKHPNKL